MRDTFSGDFSLATAAAFAVGGIAALLLATALAWGGYGRATTGTAAGGAPSPPASSSAEPDTEVEYLVDTAEPASSAR